MNAYEVHIPRNQLSPLQVAENSTLKYSIMLRIEAARLLISKKREIVKISFQRELKPGNLFG